MQACSLFYLIHILYPYLQLFIGVLSVLPHAYSVSLSSVVCWYWKRAYTLCPFTVFYWKRYLLRLTCIKYSNCPSKEFLDYSSGIQMPFTICIGILRPFSATLLCFSLQFFSSGLHVVLPHGQRIEDPRVQPAHPQRSHQHITQRKSSSHHKPFWPPGHCIYPLPTSPASSRRCLWNPWLDSTSYNARILHSSI